MALRITADISQQCYQRAMERAAANRAAGRIPTRNADGTYRVESASGTKLYTVRIHNLTTLSASCNCAHGISGGPGVCHHIISACSEEVRRLGGKYTVKPRRALSLSQGFTR